MSIKLQDFPTEILTHIALFLPISDQIEFRKTCRSARDAVGLAAQTLARESLQRIETAPLPLLGSHLEPDPLKHPCWRIGNLFHTINHKYKIFLPIFTFEFTPLKWRKLEEKIDLLEKDTVVRLILDQTAIPTGGAPSPSDRRLRMQHNRETLLHITRLTLNRLFLKRLPKEMGYLTNLTILKISHNRIDLIPEEIGELSELTLLDCTDNQLTTLPESFSRLSLLQTLRLGSNHFKSLPPLYNRNLEKLSLENNQLTSFPEEVCHLPQLSALDLSYNPIETLPSSIGTLKRIQALYLTGTLIQKVPKEIEGCRQLEDLYLEKCQQLTQLPDTLVHLKHLTLVDLSGSNALDSFSLALTDLVVSGILYKTE